MNEPERHIVLKCSGDACGMRYPSPADDSRRGTCPLCESPTTVVGDSAAPHLPESGDAPSTEVVGVLDNIRSALNVGTMLRSADGAQLDHVYLCGLTAAADNPKVIKTALGAEQTVSTTSWLDGVDCVAALKADAYEIWAIESTSRSRPATEATAVPPKLAFIVGNERAGIDPTLLALADRHLHLPMGGSKTSLNVGVAFGIAAFLLRTLPAERAER